jgi:TonB family protein
MLVYLLLTFCLIGGIAGLKFGTKLPNWRTWSDVRRAKEIQNELRPSEINAFKPALVASIGKSSDATERSSPPNIDPSPPNNERGRLTSLQEDKGVSSAALAIRAERPKLPPSVQSTITSDNIVDVRVQIDNSGTVTSATAVSAKGPVANSLADYALEAARRWRFRPARDGGQPVESDRVLEFLFRPSDFSPQ